jgi:3-hydroxyacyl-[acyl-carrier-protein] dehydratase
MPATPPLIDFTTLASLPVVHDVDRIEAVNPHRGCMRLLDAVTIYDVPARLFAAYKDIEHDAFWCEGHIPGRPIFPGVLMIEAAAQLASYSCLSQVENTPFMGFIGCNDVKFRGMVRPGDRFYIALRQAELRPRRCTCIAQGFVNGQMCFEGTIQGMPM